MKKFAIYILGVIALSMASCITLEDNFAPVNKGGVLSVMASVADFSTVNVGTKSGENDSHVDSLTMILFDKNGNLLGKPIYMGDINSSFTIDPKNGRIIDGTEAILLIPEGKQESEYDLTACSIYMVANATDVLREKIKEDQRITESAFLDINIPVPSIGIPEDGIPMIGKYDKPVDLSDAASDATVANVTMKKLYAKVNVRFQVNAIQVADIPSFTINNWTVRNIPKFVRLGEQENAETLWANSEEDKESKVFDATPSTGLTEGNHTIYHSASIDNPEYFQFTFYVPEHKVQPDSQAYPEGTSVEDPQRYKPLLCSEDKNPMYVTVNGEYIDHNSIVKSVTYSLYLGQNNTDNFEVKRNQELNNIITIKGLTNSASAATPENPYNISVDHRVVVNFEGFSLSMEREAILDSHFEVRPLDITLSPSSSIIITIPKNYLSWIAMEKNSTGLDFNGNNSPYISGKGVRKYFTTNLVSELNGTNDGTLTLTNSTDAVAKHRVWIYIDENVNVYDKLLGEPNGVTSSPSDGTYTVGKNMYRLGKIDIEYTKGDVTTPVSLNMQQWNLWRVWNSSHTRYYDIEHEEEYLNNYASDQGYGQTDQDGMTWGLNDVELSHIHEAIDPSKTSESLGSWLIDNLGPLIGIDSMEGMARKALGQSVFYDFYISRDLSQQQKDDGFLKYNDYSGYYFNTIIADYIKQKYPNQQKGTNDEATIDGLILTESPRSAFAYCYNKNKRNVNGEVVNQKWFLPAIDEIEDIALGAYDEFDKVFQNQSYWSCQPAYNRNLLYAEVNALGTSVMQADYFTDNTSRARSTSVYTTDGKTYNPVSSEAPNQNSNEKRGTGRITMKYGIVPTGIEFKLTDNIKSIPESAYPDGNKLRLEKCRVRAVFRSGTVSAQ